MQEVQTNENELIFKVIAVKTILQNARHYLFQLLLRAELGGVAALLLSAVLGASRQAGIAPDQKYERPRKTHNLQQTYLRQIIFSQLKVLARAANEGSNTPPRSLSTR